jgi:hypothetical protein
LLKYNDAEAGCAIALEEIAKSDVNQKMWLKACTHGTDPDETKSLYVKYRIMQREAVFLAELLIDEKRDSELISQDIWDQYDRQRQNGHLNKQDATAKRIYWIDFFLQKAFNQRTAPITPGRVESKSLKILVSGFCVLGISVLLFFSYADLQKTEQLQIELEISSLQSQQASANLAREIEQGKILEKKVLAERLKKIDAEKVAAEKARKQELANLAAEKARKKKLVDLAAAEERKKELARLASENMKKREKLELEAEKSRCEPARKQLDDWDAYVERNFNAKILKKKRADAGIAGLISYGSGRGSTIATANFDMQIAAQLRANQKERMEIVLSIVNVGC